MSTVVRFSPELGRWLQGMLDAGQMPQALVATMRGKGMNESAAPTRTACSRPTGWPRR